MPKKLSQFWQELKRRNVVRVIAVYAGAAFVIIELINNITEPLRLPEWTPTLVIVLLAIGFPVVIIFTWIYDVHPDGGIVKTESAQKVRNDDIPKSSNSWKIASYISFVVIVGLIFLNVIPRTGQKRVSDVLDKSIAVLPFISLSDDPEKQYQADGVMDAILLHLYKIEDLRVMSRTSVEQYRDTDMTINEICEELGVSYILEGSFRRYEDQARLIVQLIQSGKEGHIWANNYDRDWKDIFKVESEIAQAIAGELRAIITQEEKDLIEKVPTSNLTAYDFYQRGREEYNHFYWGEGGQRELEKAELFFHRALEYDSTYAVAYTGLAFVHLHKHARQTFLSEEFLDSALMFANIAQSFDNQLSDAFLIKGICYSQKGKHKQAIDEFNQSIRYNPNNWWAYSERAHLYDLSDDLVGAISDLQKAASLNHDTEFPVLLRQLCFNYTRAGFFEKAKDYNWQALQLDNDSSEYYIHLSRIEALNNNLEKASDYGEKAFELDSNIGIEYLTWWLLRYYLYQERYEESLVFVRELINRRIPIMGISEDFAATWIGYVYWKNGFKEEADYYFNEQISYHKRMIQLERESASMFWTYYYVAGIYALKGESKKALENLNFFNQRPRMCLWEVISLHHDPVFDSIRDEPEFRQILRDVEAKYQAEHERVRQWLEENEML